MLILSFGVAFGELNPPFNLFIMLLMVFFLVVLSFQVFFFMFLNFL